MLNYNTSIKQDEAYSDLEMKEIKPIMKLMFKLTLLNPFGKSVWKLDKSLKSLLMEQRQCIY